MTYHDAVRRAYAASIDLIRDGESVKIRSVVDPPPAAILTELRRHRGEIVAALTEQRIGERDGYASALPRRFLVPPGCIAAGACHRLGQCDRYAAGQPCLVGEVEREDAA